MSTKWVPKSVLALKNYSRQDFVADLIAGITVGLVALPLAMAFAIASGVPPQAGLYTAVVAGFLISAKNFEDCIWHLIAPSCWLLAVSSWLLAFS